MVSFKISICYAISTLTVGIAVLLNSWALIFLSLFSIVIYAFYLDQKVAVSFKKSITNSKLLMNT